MMLCAKMLTRADTPEFALRTKPNTRKGKGNNNGSAKGKEKASGVPKRREMNGLGFLLDTKSENNIATKELETDDVGMLLRQSLSDEDIESPCAQRQPSKASS